MRVLFAIAHLDKGGGQVVQTLQLFRVLRKKVDGHLLCLSARGDGPSIDLEEGIEVVGPLTFPGGIFRLRRAIRDRMRSYDLVQAYDFYYALPAARLARAHPIVVRVGAHPVDDFGSRYRWAGRTWMRLTNPWVYSDTTVVVNAEHLVSTFPRGKAVCIPNGVDTSRFAASPRVDAARTELGLPLGAPLLTFTGKIVPRKNLEDLFGLLRNEPTYHVLLVGTTSEPYYGDQYYRRLCAEFSDVLSRVHSVGEVPMEKIPRFLEATDVFVFPSRLEGMPNSVLEAMAAALPVVASDIPAHQQVLTRETGALYRTTDELRQAVARLVADGSVRRAMGGRARALVEQRFSLDAAARAYLALYEQTIAAAK
ncbi:MAG: glycosyltransferase family 4 protein [Thermoplasmata archaeon]